MDEEEIKRKFDIVVRSIGYVARAAGFVRGQHQGGKTLGKANDEIIADRLKNDSEYKEQITGNFLIEEAKKQNNLRQIAEKTIPLIEEKGRSEEEEIDPDWSMNFRHKASFYSNEDMQNIWAKILAGEINKRGSFSKRTLEIVHSMDKEDAKLFTRFCGFAMSIGGMPQPIVFREPFYERHGMTFDRLEHLDSIGLIKHGGVSGYSISISDNIISISYGGTVKRVELLKKNPKKRSEYELDLGKTLFSQAGGELLPICGSQPVPDHFTNVLRRWVEEGKISIKT